MTTASVGIGVIGCGNVSEAYLATMRGFPILDVIGVADRKPDAARARAEQFSLEAMNITALLADPRIEVVVNLTVPQSHVDIGMMALDAGKHVYSEKPLALTVADGKRLLERATAKGLRAGCAPDTFLGAGLQTCRRLIDGNVVGRVVGGTAFFLSPGHEHWHPNPAFYYVLGGGPLLDMAPYYLTSLVTLLGPVRQVSGSTSRLRSERLVTSAPLSGSIIPVEVSTHVAATLEFSSGAIVSIATSFDVLAHHHRPIELYGLEGSISVPDPNKFGGTVELYRSKEAWHDVPLDGRFAQGNLRGLGVADLAHAIRENRPHRASGELALHVLEVIEAIQQSADVGRHVAIESQPTRPAPFSELS